MTRLAALDHEMLADHLEESMAGRSAITWA
jgi:hypothetical protein